MSDDFAELGTDPLDDFAELGAEPVDDFAALAEGEDEQPEDEFAALGAESDDDFAELGEDFSFVGEAARALTAGVRDAAQDTIDLARRTFRPDPSSLDPGEDAPVIPPFFEPGETFTGADLPEVEQPETTLGRLGKSVTEFLVPFGLLGKAQKAAGIARAGTRAGRLAEGTVKGAIAEQIVVDPHEARLSNMIQDLGIQTPVTDYLAADPEDSTAEARFKMSLEGAGLGAVLEPVFNAVGAIKAFRRNKPPPENLPPKIDPEVAKVHESRIDLSTNIEGAKRAGRIKEPEIVTDPLPDNLNQGRIETTDDVKRFLSETAEANANFTPARRGVVSHDETRRLATLMNMTDEELIAKRGSEILAHDVVAARQHLVKSAEEVQALMLRAKANPGPQELFDFEQAMVRNAAIQEEVSREAAEAGRLLNSYNIIAKSPTVERVKAMQELIDKDGGRIGDALDVISKMETPEQIARAARDAVKPRTIDQVVEVWVNGLLSGPQTHAVNMLSNTLVALWSIPEHLTAAGIGAIRGAKAGDKVFAREALGRLYGFAQGGLDGTRAFWEALKDPTSVPEGAGTKLEIRPNSLGEGFLGQLVNIPGRLLNAEDRLFQAIGYRQELNALAMESGLKKGLKGRELARHMKGVVNDPPATIKAKSMDMARYQTFTQPLGKGGQSIQQFANEHPSVRFIFPFIRTPVNIMKFTFAERTPMALFSKKFRDNIAAGGREADIAKARLTLASALGAGITTLALDGTVTGGGPSDPTERAVWREKFAPYSIKIGDEWVSYQRLEPLGTLVGVSADLAEVVRMGQAEDVDADEMRAKIVASVATNMMSKTWLKGASDLVKMLNDPDRYGDNWINSYVGSAVPAIVAQEARIQDPFLKDVRTSLDAIKARVPVLSEDVARRISVFGEPIRLEGGLGPDRISPLWVSSDKPHPVAEEMLRLKKAGVDAIVSRPPKKIRGIELEPQDYMEYSIEAGRTSTKMAEAFIKSPVYQALPDGLKGEQLKKVFMAGRNLIREMYSVKLDIPRKAAEEKTKRLSK